MWPVSQVLPCRSRPSPDRDSGVVGVRGMPGCSVLRGSMMRFEDGPVACAVCGIDTIERVFASTLSVERADGRRRVAPLIPICASCRSAIAHRDVFSPSWCPSCGAWRPFGHRHGESAHEVRLPVSPAVATRKA
jgi:hypothetical protein